MSETATETTGTESEGQEQQQEQTFTQADVDRIVKERVTREKAKYADYDDLKTKAAGAQTLEDRVAGLESTATAAARRAEVAEVANEKGLTPNQAKRLVGNTRDELLADADELLKDIAAQQQNNNVSPREGQNSISGESEERQFAQNLFAGD